MNLIRYNPFNNRSLNQFVDDFFNSSLTNFIGRDNDWNVPSVNVIENQDSYRIEVAAPGLEKEDFEVKVDNGLLHISARREHTDEVKEEGKYMRREFNFTSFSRSFQLPEGAKAEDIKAAYENGVLNVTLPKTAEVEITDPHVIEIK